MRPLSVRASLFIVAVLLGVACVGMCTFYYWKLNRALVEWQSVGGSIGDAHPLMVLPKTVSWGSAPGKAVSTDSSRVANALGQLNSMSRIDNCTISSNTLQSEDLIRVLGKIDPLALWISSPNIDDNVLKAIASIKRLSQVNISGGRYSERGLGILCEHQSLQMIYLRDIDLSGESLKRLKEQTAKRIVLESDRESMEDYLQWLRDHSE